MPLGPKSRRRKGSGPDAREEPVSKHVFSDSKPWKSAVDMAKIPGAVRRGPGQGLGGRAGA